MKAAASRVRATIDFVHENPISDAVSSYAGLTPAFFSPQPARRMSGRSRLHTAAARLQAPRARKNRVSFTLHGNLHADDFAYLRDPGHGWTRSYIRSETDYFNACIGTVSNSRQRLYEELKSRIIESDVSVPESIDGHLYYTRTEAGRQYPVHYRVPEAGGEEQVYLDENLLAAGESYCDVSVVSVCPDRDRFACAVDRTGDERYDVLVGSMNGGEMVVYAAHAGDSIAWARNGASLIYTSTDDNARPDAVWMYELDSDSRECLFREPDPAFHVSVWTSRSGQWIFIDSAGNTSSETRALPARSPRDEPVVVFPRRPDIEYTVEHHQERFLVLINDEAENFRLVSVPVPNGERRIIELLPPQDDTSLEFVDAYRHHLVVGERRCGVQKSWVWDLDSGKKEYLPGSGEMVFMDVEDLYDYSSRTVRYEYSTPVAPHSIYDYDITTGQRTRRKTSNPPGYLEDAYACERRYVPADGVEVPLTLVYRAETLESRDGPAPLLLMGYGAYEESVDMDFDSDLVSLLDRGVIVALTHVRGGGDLGPEWHDAGRLADKEHSFTDFLACADYLVANGLTAPGRIAAWGASAGGLLAAVAVQRRPELFASAVLEVPFLDVLNTLLDPELPLSEYDFDEFGDPSVEEEYEWIRAYSPYDNIHAQAYPPMLVTAAMNDQRVGYWEALKWVARLRDTKTDDNPLLLKIDPAGHLGESGRYEAVRDSAIVYTFLLDAWGLLPDD